MKHNWEYKRLGDVCSFERGVTYSKDDESEFESDVVILRSNNIDLDSGSLNFSDLKYLNSDFQIKETKKLKANTILICMSNGSLLHLGKTAFVPNNYNMAFGGFMGLIIPKSQHPKYLSYVLRSPIYYKFLDGLNRGANIRNLQFSKLSQLNIPVPPIEVQDQIVAELDQINDLIAKNRELLSQLDALAQSLFYDTFGDPISNPKGWSMKKLSDECIDIVDGDHSAPPKATEGVPFITISNIDKYTNSIDFSNSFFVPQSYYDGLKNNRKARNGDVLYTVTGSYGITVLIENQPDFCFQRHIGLLRPKHTLNSVFLAHWGRSSAIKSYADKVATGIAQKTVSLTSLRNFPLIFPPLELQEKFAERVEQIDAQKKAVEEMIANLQTLLDSRMDYWFN